MSRLTDDQVFALRDTAGETDPAGAIDALIADRRERIGACLRALECLAHADEAGRAGDAAGIPVEIWAAQAHLEMAVNGGREGALQETK